MDRQTGTPLQLQAAEAFGAQYFLQRLNMSRADAERLFNGADWGRLLGDFVPVRRRISCADALAAFRPLLERIAPEPAEGWLPYV